MDYETRDWIIVHDGTYKRPYRLECLRCGKIQDIEVPMKVNDFIKTMKKFTDIHKECKGEKNV